MADAGGLMSELTQIAEIIARNMGNALLAIASEISKQNTPPPLSQASEKPKSVSIIDNVPWKRFTYQARDKVIVQYPDQEFPLKCRILKRVSQTEYLVYPQQGLKAQANKVTSEMILGIDPDK
jgi:hypothetical protein